MVGVVIALLPSPTIPYRPLPSPTVSYNGTTNRTVTCSAVCGDTL
jgi:hypothetical protein